MNSKNLRIVFMGTPDFAVGCLKLLIENHYNIVGVITSPDKPAGRGRQMNESAVKKYAKDKNLKILQPEKLKNPEFLSELKSLKADLQIVVAFRMLPEVVWDMPMLGTFNLHASLLPQYRGAAPINRAIINGEKETGVTTFLLDHQIDTGKILFQEKISIGKNDNAGVVHDRLLETGAKLILKTVDAIAEGKIEPLKQDGLIGTEELKHAPKIFKEDCRINWKDDVVSIHNLIRGLSPYPAAWTEFKKIGSEKTITTKIFASEVELDDNLPASGVLKTDGKTYLKVATKNGWIKITDLQLAGKKRMKTDEFLRGFQNAKDYFLT